MAQMVRYYRIDKGKNRGVTVAFGEWPERVLRHRGWTQERLVYQRVATEKEHEWLEGCMRYQAFRYSTLDSLLEDERAALADDEALLAQLTKILSGENLEASWLRRCGGRL